MAVESVTITRSFPLVKEEVSVTVTVDDTLNKAVLEAREALYLVEREQAVLGAMLGSEWDESYGTKIATELPQSA